jgi:hypothetical protein
MLADITGTPLAVLLNFEDKGVRLVNEAPRAVGGRTFTLGGEGFEPGTVNVSVDTVNGQALGRAGSATRGGGSASIFQAAEEQIAPRRNSLGPTVLGNHKIVANQIVGGQTSEANVTGFAQEVPK